MDKDKKIIEIAEIIGYGVHAGLRKNTDSKEAVTAWESIRDMPNDEWYNICKNVAELIMKTIK